MDPEDDEPEIEESDTEDEPKGKTAKIEGDGDGASESEADDDGASESDAEEDGVDDEDAEEDDDEASNSENVVAARPFAEFDNFSDDDDEDDDDANYLQKFDALSQQKIISDFHPELKSLNYDEVEVLSRIVRDENGNIIDPFHKTLPFITKYEKARILGERAKQIDGGAKPLVEVDVSVIDGYLIALKEYESKAIPFIIQRPLPSGGSEYWKFSDLEILA
jgi:DNA-directed RNA polymerase I, II, and III subunit RPABC2